MAPIQPPKRLTPGVPFDVSPGRKATSLVKITAHPQKDGKSIFLTLEDLVPPANLPPTGGFTPGRVVINIRLSKNEDMSTPATEEMVPPGSDPVVTLSINIIPADVQRAAEKGIKYFKVGYFHKGEWHLMADNIPTDTKEVLVPFSKFGDPPIGISP